MQEQSREGIPFREDYFLPEDEAGAAGTIRVDEVSSADEGADDMSAACESQSNKVANAAYGAQETQPSSRLSL